MLGSPAAAQALGTRRMQRPPQSLWCAPALSCLRRPRRVGSPRARCGRQVPGWMAETWLVPGAGWGGFPTPFLLGLETARVVRCVWGRGRVGTGGGLRPLPCVAAAAWAPGSGGEACACRGLGAVGPSGVVLGRWWLASQQRSQQHRRWPRSPWPCPVPQEICHTHLQAHAPPVGAWAADTGTPGSPGAWTYAVPSVQSPRSRHLPPRAGPALPSLCPQMAWAELRWGAGGWTWGPLQPTLREPPRLPTLCPARNTGPSPPRCWRYPVTDRCGCGDSGPGLGLYVSCFLWPQLSLRDF